VLFVFLQGRYLELRVVVERASLLALLSNAPRFQLLVLSLLSFLSFLLSFSSFAVLALKSVSFVVGRDASSSASWHHVGLRRGPARILDPGQVSPSHLP
jgi:hypothetical protein